MLEYFNIISKYICHNMFTFNAGLQLCYLYAGLSRLHTNMQVILGTLMYQHSQSRIYIHNLYSLTGCIAIEWEPAHQHARSSVVRV